MKTASQPWESKLIDWFIVNQRYMPWREKKSAYTTWVSEIMLQQTQVDTVIPYFNHFIEKFPTVTDLAKADQQSVLKAWEGLGYYSRARNLHKAAQKVVNERCGIIPSNYEQLQTLPGLGPYCAAAVASLAFEEPVPVIDGNVLRVFARFWGIETDIRQKSVRDDLFNRLKPSIQKCKPSDFNQAMMELGALICRPLSPQCDRCPIQHDCYAKQNQKQAQLPYKSKAEKTPHYTIVVGVIQKSDGTVLLGKRKETQMLGGLWEFPGGKVKDTEGLKEALSREILEETTLNVKIEEELCVVKHAYTHFKITLHAYLCTYISGNEKALSAEILEWVSIDDLIHRPFPKANKKVLEAFTKKDLCKTAKKGRSARQI